MATDHTVAYVSRIPNCDYGHAVPTPADVDGRTTEGPWASMCTMHFYEYGCGLGQGKGQRYVLGEPPVTTEAERREEARRAVLANDIDAFFDACGDGDPMDYLY